MHGTAWLSATLLLVVLIRWSWRRSALLGFFVLLGVLARVIGGTVLFWISSRHLPIFEGLQMGNGFWLLALDGATYYNSAQFAAAHGLSTISSTSASPAYVRLLAIALRACGDSFLTAVLLNTVAYALSCAACILMWPRRPSGSALASRAIVVVALSFAPSLLLASTQPLKDQVFTFLVVAAVACIRAASTEVTIGRPGALVNGALAFGGAAAAVYEISGIRAYYGVMIVVAVTVVMGLFTLTLPLRRWALHVVATIASAALLWVAFTSGAGPYAAPYEQFLWKTLAVSSARPSAGSATPLDTAREGFVATGGATNIVRAHAPGSQPWSNRIMDEATGLMALFVPISVLRGLSAIDFNGGRGLLLITDIDTIFLDLTIGMQLWILLQCRQWPQHSLVFLAFTMVVAAGVMFPMAYVVTNYGTMFRLRLLYATPLWLSGAAVASSLRLQRAVSIQGS